MGFQGAGEHAPAPHEITASPHRRKKPNEELRLDPRAGTVALSQQYWKNSSISSKDFGLRALCVAARTGGLAEHRAAVHRERSDAGGHRCKPAVTRAGGRRAQKRRQVKMTGTSKPSLERGERLPGYAQGTAFWVSPCGGHR